eukprot:TRINITY_DN31467_c0_g1_i3.p1 TRINITY_DN31467_c0_g1~~TRINITY_DN31467_c0_g1_i3.p1  ORF type:complete len:454 (-),score=28.83 TRINITY_DN31467_c0_g1_i3:337-1698(-)
MAWRWVSFTAEQNAAILKGAADARVELPEGTLDKKSLTWSSKEGWMTRAQSFQVCWQWDDGSGGVAAPTWKTYAPEEQLRLEHAYYSKHSDMRLSVGDAMKKDYVVDLVGMRQRAIDNAFQCRRVRRVGVPLRERYPMNVYSQEADAWLDLSGYPSYWLWPTSLTDAPCRTELSNDSVQFKRISEWMNQSIRTGHALKLGKTPEGHPTKGMLVEKVEAVWAPALWRRYKSYLEFIKTRSKEIKAHPGTAYLRDKPMALPECDWLDHEANERYFWHGTGKSPDGSKDLLKCITTEGIEPSDEDSELAEVADGASSRFSKETSMFGSGIYLADLSSKANLYVPCPICHGGAYFRHTCQCGFNLLDADPYSMLLCRAALGRVHVETNFKEEYLRETYKQKWNPAQKFNADSVMGEAAGKLRFREYIVYNDSAIYPEFVVHYRRLGHPLKEKPSASS